MCCMTDCKPDLKPGDWTPCIECMDAEELSDYRKQTGDKRKWGWVVKGTRKKEERSKQQYLPYVVKRLRSRNDQKALRILWPNLLAQRYERAG